MGRLRPPMGPGEDRESWRAILPMVSCLKFTQRSLKLGFGHAPKPGIGYG